MKKNKPLPEVAIKKSESFWDQPQEELRVAVTGVDPGDLRVEVTREALLVKGETRKEEKKEEGTICISEFQSGALFRCVHFPKKIDPTRVKAKLKNGMLTVTASIAETTTRRKAAVKSA